MLETRGLRRVLGKKLICVSCQILNNAENIIASNEVEDWRGMGKEIKETKGIYLQKGMIVNECTLEKNIQKIPIIRNGNTSL